MLAMMIALAVITGFIALAKRGRGRRRSMGRYIRGEIDLVLACGTLASKTAILGSTQTVVERAIVTSVLVTYSFSGFTEGDNIGPVSVGVAHSDYSLVEIEAFLELTAGWSEANLVAQETARRKIRRIGVFSLDGTGAGGVSVLNDGRPVKTKLNWILSSAQGLNFFIYNSGGAAFTTTDPDLHVLGHANIFPK